MEKSVVLAALAALAQESRLDIFRLLVRAGNQGLAVGCIGDKLGYPSPTLSFHLNQLKQAGLVTVRREGRSLIYAANVAAMSSVMAYLTKNCCGGSAAHCAGEPPTTCESASSNEGATDDKPARAFAE